MGTSSTVLDGQMCTRGQAARILDCSPITIGRMCRDGRLNATSIGVGKRRTHWRIPMAELLEYAKLQQAAQG